MPSILDCAPTSQGHALDLAPDAWGELRDSSALLFDGDALRQRLQNDGYLYLPGLLARDEVIAARRELCERLARAGCLRPNTDPLEALAAQDYRGLSMEALARDNAPLQRVLYRGAMIDFYRRLLGGEVRHFDYTWVRSVGPGRATPPHTDAVYMNRGTHNLFTSWTPLIDTDAQTGGLMMLENSQHHAKLRANYSSKDVDAFCENRVGASYTKMGGGGNIRRNGALTDDPVKLRQALGGRWMTTDFQMGDLLMFSIFTVHASLDNRSDRVRLSSDSRYQLASETADPRWIGANPAGHGAASKRAMIC